MKGFRFGSALGSFYILPGNGGWKRRSATPCSAHSRALKWQPTTSPVATASNCPNWTRQRSKCRTKSPNGKSFTSE